MGRFNIMAANSKEPADIVDSMASEIGQYLLSEQLNEYDCRAITSAYNWQLDGIEVQRSYWNGSGKIKFSAKADFSGEHPTGESIFGADKVNLEIEGVLIDPKGNYKFEIELIKVISGEERGLDGEFWPI